MYSRSTCSLTNNSVASDMSNLNSGAVTRLRCTLTKHWKLVHVGPMSQMLLSLLFGLTHESTALHDTDVVRTLTLHITQFQGNRQIKSDTPSEIIQRMYTSNHTNLHPVLPIRALHTSTQGKALAKYSKKAPGIPIQPCSPNLRASIQVNDCQKTGTSLSSPSTAHSNPKTLSQ